MNKIYTGIGSRQITEEIYNIFIGSAIFLAKLGYTLRSGGASGADSAFEAGCDFESGAKEIYLPWKNFNDNKSELHKPCDGAAKIAERIHPAWDKLSHGAKKLHSRNVYQLLGKELNKPSDFLICWTLDGQDIGGTRTAIMLARENGVPVYNLGLKGQIEVLRLFLKSLHV